MTSRMKVGFITIGESLRDDVDRLILNPFRRY